MQVNRLFEIVYILLDKKTVTARELSEHFEVSVRTIYRDIDVLSAARIPIYTSKGKSGGISIMDNFVLNKSMLSEKEQEEILMSLKSLRGIKFIDVEPVLRKLSVVFNKESSSWIEVDFSPWGSNDNKKEKFDIIKRAILNKRIVSFDYYNSNCERSLRNVEPFKLVFKGQEWYLYGFCRLKNEFRIFKITRIKKLNLLAETFERDDSNSIWNYFDKSYSKMITIVLKIDEKMAYRVYDEFDEENIERNIDGSFLVNATFPKGEWIFAYIMSYGDYAEVIGPDDVRETIKKKFKAGFMKYKGID